MCQGSVFVCVCSQPIVACGHSSRCMVVGMCTHSILYCANNSMYIAVLSLTDDLRNLVALQVLDLRHNRFKEIPSIIFQLTALKTLYLRCNKIKVVQPELGNLQVLCVCVCVCGRARVCVWEEG